MPETTIGVARNNFSAIIADIVSGAASGYVIKRRDVPVAKILPYNDAVNTDAQPHRRQFGLFKDEMPFIDDDVFDSLDEEISDEFGL